MILCYTKNGKSFLWVSLKGLLMFALHEKVVYPGHGVAQVTSIVEKNVAGVTTTYYELKFLTKDVTILVPTTNAEAVGIRKLSSSDHIDDIFKILATPAKKISHYEFTASTWNKRNKEYKLKLGRGGLKDLSEIYRDLRFIETQKELSFGEKNLLSQTEVLIGEEISLVHKCTQEQIIKQLRTICKKSLKSPQQEQIL